MRVFNPINSNSSSSWSFKSISNFKFSTLNFLEQFFLIVSKSINDDIDIRIYYKSLFDFIVTSVIISFMNEEIKRVIKK